MMLDFSLSHLPVPYSRTLPFEIIEAYFQKQGTISSSRHVYTERPSQESVLGNRIPALAVSLGSSLDLFTLQCFCLKSKDIVVISSTSVTETHIRYQT